MRTVTALLSIGALAGCVERVPEPVVASDTQAIAAPTVDARAPAPAPASADLPTRVASDLKRLADLRVVEVHARAEPAYDEAAVERLDRFTAIAERAAAMEADDASADQKVTENLDALRGLQIVDVEALVYDEPSRGAGHCYGPCPPSTKAEHRRAVQLARIAEATKDL